VEKDVLESPDQQAPNPKKTQRRYDWSAIEDAFFLSSFDSFPAFLRAAGYPEHLRKAKGAKGIGERRRKLLEHAQKNLVPAGTPHPISETLQIIESAKRSGIKEYAEFAKSASAIRFACDLTLKAHLELARQKPGEGKDQWIRRVGAPSTSAFLLSPTDLACIATAVHKAQDMTRNIIGLDESEWNDKLRAVKDAETPLDGFRVEVINPEALPEPAGVEALHPDASEKAQSS
jgi:hypothetical protein